MKFDLAHILAFFVLLFFIIADMLFTVLNAATGILSFVSYMVSSARNLFSPVDEYPVDGAYQSQSRIKKRRRVLGQSPGMIGRIIACLAWISLPVIHCLPSLAITILNLVVTCVNKAKEWNPFNHFALLRQLKAAQREARLLEEGLYQSTGEIKNLKALYKSKEQENMELRRRVEEVEEDRTIVVEDLKARIEEKTNQEETLEEEKKALVQEMETLRKEKDVEIEVLKIEKDAEIVTLKEEIGVIEEKNAEQIVALNKENEGLREEKAAVEKENEILKEENTKTHKKVEELEVAVKVAQDKAKVASAQVKGMEIAQNKEREKRMETESTVIIIREELKVAEQDVDQEKMGREAERVAMELERAAFKEDIRKSQEEHRQEVNAFVGQLQGAWNRALELDSQLDVAIHQNNALQDQLKEAQDSLVTITEEKNTLGLENQSLRAEVAGLREEVVRAIQKKKEVEEKEHSVERKVIGTDLGIDLEKLKRDFEARDVMRRDIPRSDGITVGEDSSVTDGEDTVLDITTNRFDTPGRKKQPTIDNKVATLANAILVATKDNPVIGADIPVVRLPATGTTRVLPPIQGGSMDIYVPPVEATSMISLSFDPTPIQVRLPTAPEAPISKDTRGDSRSSQPVKLKESPSSHPKKLKWRRGRGRGHGGAQNNAPNQTLRSPLGSITNQSLHKHPDKGMGK